MAAEGLRAPGRLVLLRKGHLGVIRPPHLLEARSRAEGSRDADELSAHAVLAEDAGRALAGGIGVAENRDDELRARVRAGRLSGRDRKREPSDSQERRQAPPARALLRHLVVHPPAGDKSRPFLARVQALPLTRSEEHTS